MISRQDPERREVVEARVSEFGRQFRAGEISLHVFRAHLHGLGLRGHLITHQVSLWWPDTTKSRNR